MKVWRIFDRGKGVPWKFHHRRLKYSRGVLSQ